MFLADGGKSCRRLLESTGEPWRPEMAAYTSAKELGTYDMWQLHLERSDLQRRYLAKWSEHGVDAILGPTTPYATVPHGTFRYVGYTGIWNILDYSAVSFPTRVNVDKSLDAKSPSFVAMSDVDQLIYDEYDASLVQGMPISLQLIAKRLEEEKVFSMLHTIENAL